MKAWIAQWWSRKAVYALKAQVGKEPIYQKRLLKKLLKKGQSTRFGEAHRLAEVHDYEAFRQAVPIYTYEQLWEAYWVRAWEGLPNQTWPGRPRYFAKTSGTTAGAKLIPISADSVLTQVRGAQLTLAAYLYRTRRTDFIGGRWLFLSGSPALEKSPAGIPYGRLSGIVHHWVPSYLTANRLPSFAINTIQDWLTKVQAILDEAIPLPLTLLSGIPPWILQFLELLQEKTQRKVLEVWPRLQVYVHGGVDFRLYEERLRAYLPGVDFIETFPASEGFFAFQDTDTAEVGLRLLVENGVFYEFIPLEAVHKPNPPRYPLWEVQKGKRYAMIITTNAGLWAYNLGDVVEFTSVAPYRVRVVGRVKNHLSAFGEHVIEYEVETAIGAAALETGAQISEYTVGPSLSPPRHEWVVAFQKMPSSIEAFQKALDQELARLNPYYADLRKGAILGPPALYSLAPDTFYQVLASLGKVGGQNKPPHLKSDRSLLELLLPHATLLTA